MLAGELRAIKMKKLILNIRSWILSSANSEVKKTRLSLWKRHRTIKDYRNALESRIIKRAEKDVLNGDIDKAISRYEGFFQYYSTNQNQHNRIAELYIHKEDKVRAGRHLFLKENLSETEKQCVRRFEKSCGNSSTIILKKLLPKENFRVKELTDHQKIKLKKLVNDATRESGVTPNFLKGIKRYLDKIKAANKIGTKKQLSPKYRQ
jgi:hypothetical protein